MKKSFSKIHAIILLLLIFVLTDGCVPIDVSLRNRAYYKKNVLEYFDKAEGGINKLINIDGYYVPGIMHNNSRGGILSGDGSLIFFNDGSFSRLYWKEEPPLFIGVPNISLNVHLRKYRDCRTLIEVLWKKKYELQGGVYVLKNDTIIAEYKDMEDDLFRYTFKVKDRNSILLLNANYVFDIKQGFKKVSYDNMPEEYRTLRFIPAHDLPSPTDMYNKNLRFRWSDGRHWNNYKSQRRKYFKNKKKHL